MAGRFKVLGLSVGASKNSTILWVGLAAAAGFFGWQWYKKNKGGRLLA